MSKQTKFEATRDKALAWLANHPIIEAVLWFLAAAALIGILVWFLLFSNFGAPPEFVYQQF